MLSEVTDITDRSRGYFDHVTKDLSKKKKEETTFPLVSTLLYKSCKWVCKWKEDGTIFIIIAGLRMCQSV